MEKPKGKPEKAAADHGGKHDHGKDELALSILETTGPNPGGETKALRAAAAKHLFKSLTGSDPEPEQSSP